MTSLAEQYAWFVDYEGSDSYCLTLVKDRSRMEILSLLGADDARIVPGMDAVWHETQEVAEPENVAAAAAMDGGVLLFEPYGFRGASKEIAERLSLGTLLVSHFRTVNADTAFMWAEDGVVQAYFELQSPWAASGAKASQMTPMLREAGFTNFESGDNSRMNIYLPAAMALAEMLTGLGITSDFLEDSQYMFATVHA